MTGILRYLSLSSFFLALSTSPVYRLFTIEHEMIVKYLAYHAFSTSGGFIQDITWPRGDTTFLFEC